MNSNTSTTSPDNQSEGTTLNKTLKSALLITLLTAIFGSLSYAFIQLNASVMQLSVPESLWCGLAMSLAVVYYLFQGRNSNKSSNNIEQS